jgi:peptidoglycan/LPS O-acetylase OafA/YrhL
MIAIMPAEPMPLSWALLVVAVLYGLPAGAWFLVWRRNRRVAAFMLAALATGLAGYVGCLFFPRSRQEFAFWLVVAAMPLLGSLCSLYLASKRVFDARKKTQPADGADTRIGHVACGRGSRGGGHRNRS